MWWGALGNVDWCPDAARHNLYIFVYVQFCVGSGQMVNLSDAVLPVLMSRTTVNSPRAGLLCNRQAGDLQWHRRSR